MCRTPLPSRLTTEPHSHVAGATVGSCLSHRADELTRRSIDTHFLLIAGNGNAPPISLMRVLHS